MHRDLCNHSSPFSSVLCCHLHLSSAVLHIWHLLSASFFHSSLFKYFSVPFPTTKFDTLQTQPVLKVLRFDSQTFVMPCSSVQNFFTAVHGAVNQKPFVKLQWTPIDVQDCSKWALFQCLYCRLRCYNGLPNMVLVCLNIVRVES